MMETLRYWVTWLGNQLYWAISLFVPDTDVEVNRARRTRLMEHTERSIPPADERPAFHPFTGLPMHGDFDSDGNLF